MALLFEVEFSGGTVLTYGSTYGLLLTSFRTTRPNISSVRRRQELELEVPSPSVHSQLSGGSLQ